MTMTAITIGQLAREAGVGVEAIRFYERKGLLAKPSTTRSGYRQYPPEAVSRLRFIQRAKGLGFTLKEIDELLALNADPDCTCDDVRRQAQAKLRTIEEKIGALERMRAALARLVAECSGEGPVSACPILETLDDEKT